MKKWMWRRGKARGGKLGELKKSLIVRGSEMERGDVEG